MNLSTPLLIERAIVVSIDKSPVKEKALLKLTHTFETKAHIEAFDKLYAVCGCGCCRIYM